MTVETWKNIIDLAGRELFEVESVGDGWPAVVWLQQEGVPVRVAMHVGAVGGSGRGRDDVERRFQNPGKDKPIQEPPGSAPLLLGLWTEGEAPVVVAMEARRRVGKKTRQSFFLRLDVLKAAVSTGWAEYVNKSSERIYVFHPSLLAAYIRLISGHIDGTDVLPSIVCMTGLLNDELTSSTARVRRLTTTLVRRAAFTRHVLVAYDYQCAMCDIELDLVQAAHIYPAHAIGSRDVVWNGLALCANHHVAFDLHRIVVDGATGALRVDPRWTPRNDPSQLFLASTLKQLRIPADVKQRPAPEMFKLRYEFYRDAYAWASPP
jgi:hypothetical protein